MIEIDCMNQMILKPLFEVLTKQMKVYQLMLDCVEVERIGLIESDMEKVSSCLTLKEKLIRESSEIEEKRLLIIDQIGKEVGQSFETMFDLANNVDEESRQFLLQSRTVLNELILSIKEKNLENEKLAQVALKSINGAIQSIQEGFQEKEAVYKPKGTKNNSNRTQGRIVSRQA